MRLSALSWSSLAAALVLAPSADAQDLPVAFSGSIAVANDYTFRGVSQTLEDPAIQGGITAEAGPVYAGVWGSNVDFGETDPDGAATAEVDFFGGVKVPLGIADADLSLTYYGYPGTSDTYEYNFIEFALGLGTAVGPIGVGLKGAYSPDFYLASGTALYIGGTLGLEIPNTPLSLAAGIGKQSIDDNGTFGLPDYMDFSAGATLSVLGIDLGATVVGTDIDGNACFGGGAPFGTLCDTRVIVSLSRGM